jgi:hypothetical protein
VAGKRQKFSLADALDRMAEESIRLLSSSPFEVWVGVQTEPDLAATSDGYTVTCVIVELTETKWCYISLTFKVLSLELKVRQAEITKVAYRCVVL